MLWNAQLKDGLFISEIQNGKRNDFLDIPKENIEKIVVKESNALSNISFSADEGIFDFNNLDFSKLQELEEGKEFKFVYNKEKGKFLLDTDSRNTLLDLILKQEYQDYISLNSKGFFEINREPYFISLKEDKSDEELLVSDGSLGFIYFKEGYTNFIGNTGNVIPLKKSMGNMSYNLGYEKEYILDDLKFYVKNIVSYNVSQRGIFMDLIMKCNRKDFKVDLDIVYGSKVHTINFMFRGDPVRISRTICMI